ncbi:HTR-like protein [Natronococcus amylolyticus DSM 10524]|uniref:histidine kinase n=1 Tax=Natronococcus amylolyticus DSM 10524 TaxID=1227497 RepID=L9XIG8_9EURY|nr:PAS domain S-box protein [Natronococcus amylolyticus]ELY60468.1 HTR-like protein [Natronococcus amylolyticus DSM 10524]
MTAEKAEEGAGGGSDDEGVREALSLREQAIDEAPVGIVITDPSRADNPITYANEGFVRVTGYARSEILGRNCRFLQGERTDPEPVERMRAAIDAGESVTVELLNYRRDGDPFWNRVTIAPLFDGNEVANFVGIQQDVTDRIRRERELEREREFVEQGLDVLDDVFYVIGTDGRLRRWNERLPEVTGYTDDEIAEMNALEFVPADEQETITRSIEDVLAGEPETVESALLTADGNRIPYEFTGSRLTDPDGELIGVVGTGREVAERTRHRTVLESLHEIATTIQTAESVDAVCERTVDAAADVLEFDLCSLLLCEDEWLVPRATSANAPTDGSRPMRLDQGLAGKTFESGESFLVDEVTPDGDADPAKDCYRSGFSVPVGDAGVFQAASTETSAFDAQDVEFAELLVSHTANAIERLEREAALERQNDRLEEFASIVSHDLRNPLNVAAGRLELAREGCDDDNLEDVARAHDRMEALIDDLLALAREGRAVLETEPVDVAAAVADCWCHVETAEASLEVETERAIEADPSRLQRLLENLVRNAVEHGGSDVTVTVGELADGIYVEDDGPGIPTEKREAVFETGYSERRGGTGFGLGIVERICDAHGWDVAVTDGADGGARFELTGLEFVDCDRER